MFFLSQLPTQSGRGGKKSSRVRYCQTNGNSEETGCERSGGKGDTHAQECTIESLDKRE